MRNKSGCKGYSGNGASICWGKEGSDVRTDKLVCYRGRVDEASLLCLPEGIAGIKPTELESRLDLL